MSFMRHEQRDDPVLRCIDLVRLVQMGARPVIVFDKDIVDLDEYPEPEMQARVTAVVSVDEKEHVAKVAVDYAEFDGHNRHFESVNYFDEENNLTLTAREKGLYKPQETLCLSLREGYDYFHLLESRAAALLDAYRRSNATFTYVEWLENHISRRKKAALFDSYLRSNMTLTYREWLENRVLAG